MRELKQTILEVINHLVNQHPELAPLVENIAQNIQGKGYLTSLEKELDLLFSFIGSKANIAIDIGGNIGSYTEQLLKRNPNMTVHIFEPSKTNIQILNDKFINNEKITINPLAVSETTGAATLFSNEPGSGLGSLSKRKLDHFGINFETTESISTIRFEDCEAYEFTKLLADMQGILRKCIEKHTPVLKRRDISIKTLPKEF